MPWGSQRGWCAMTSPARSARISTTSAPTPSTARRREVTIRSVIAGVGSALPRRRVDNEELAATVDTTDQWIVERTGIRSRYIAGDGETTASLATEAARNALEHAGVDASEI